MKINLKFGQKQESVSTGLQVHTHMLAGLECEEYGNRFLFAFPELFRKLIFDVCQIQCIAIKLVDPQS